MVEQNSILMKLIVIYTFFPFTYTNESHEILNITY